MVVNFSGCVGGPLVITAAAPLFLVSSAADPSVYMVYLAWYDAICVRLYWCFEVLSSARPAIPGTKVEIYSLRVVLNCHEGDGKWFMI